MIGIVPSILSADFTCLGDQVREAEEAGAQRIQVDVMDGHFVPNITMGPIIVNAVRHCTIQQIKAAGKMAGIALTPSTPVIMLEDILSLLDLVLIMTVNPGFGGQDFIPETLPKIAHLRQMITQRSLSCDIEVDGGIHQATAPLVVQAGANLLVAGSAIFNQRESV